MVNGQSECKFGSLDLSALSYAKLGHSIECKLSFNNDTIPGGTKFTFEYSVCDNAVNCSNTFNGGTPGPYMITESYSMDPFPQCWWIATYDSNLQPQKNSNHGGNYTFVYSNGLQEVDCPEQREHISISFVCDKNANPYDPKGVVCGEYYYCHYWLQIPTSAACT